MVHHGIQQALVLTILNDYLVNYKISKSIRAAMLGLLFLSFLADAEVSMLQSIAKMETLTRDICQAKMDDDTLEFKKCILKKISELNKIDNNDSNKLAIYYYAWLASVVAAKNGIPTAEDTALYFLPKFRVIQHKLSIDDLKLCQTIPGDCESRNARMAIMEKQIKLNKVKQ